MTKKLHFTKTEEYKAAKLITVFGNNQDIVVFRTLQIKSHDPSELTLIVEKKTGFDGRFTVTHIPLVDFRTLFIFQNNTYILDTRALDRFIDDHHYYSVRISFESLNQNEVINASVFYHLVDRDQYPEYFNRLLNEQSISEHSLT